MGGNKRLMETRGERWRVGQRQILIERPLQTNEQIAVLDGYQSTHFPALRPHQSKARIDAADDLRGSNPVK
ncbi:MAG: hypothetical protein NVSMB5_14580 [Candidatus Velthaea sp.]